MGGLPELPTALYLSLASPLLERHTEIFEMWFDHQSSEKALIFYWPEMKGIRCKNLFAKGYLDLQVIFCLFVCFFFFIFLKRGDLDIIKRCVPKHKALGFEAFQMFCWGEARRWNSMSAFRVSMNPCHQLSSISLFLTFSFFFLQNLAFTTEQIQMLDNEWLDGRDFRNRTVSISQPRAT